MKYDKTVIAYHFGQYYGLLQKEWRLPKIKIGWIIKVHVLRNGCFHNGLVICPRLSHNGPRKVVLALGVASGQYYLPWAIMTNRGHVTGPLWKHSFINTILMGLSRWLSRIQKIKKNSIFRDYVCRNMMFLESCTLNLVKSMNGLLSLYNTYTVNDIMRKDSTGSRLPGSD
jgi:hypothetical protein